MRLLTLLLLFIPAPASAQDQFPAAIPQECVEVAQREGQPLVIQNKAQALQAKAKLASLSPRDRLANQCRAAVKARQPEIDALTR